MNVHRKTVKSAEFMEKNIRNVYVSSHGMAFATVYDLAGNLRIEISSSQIKISPPPSYDIVLKLYKAFSCISL